MVIGEWIFVMDKPIVLIADANHRIRQFLKREFAAAGLTAELANSYDEIYSRLHAAPPPDLIVLDPDMPYFGARSILEQMKQGKRRIPVVIYSPYTEYADDPVFRNAAAFVEKVADPALLIQTVFTLLKCNRAHLSVSEATMPVNGKGRGK